MSVLTVTGLTKRFPGAEAAALRDVSLDVAEGEVLTIIGESGCGKTTLLRLIAGLETPTRGEIRIGERTVFDARTAVPPDRRGVGMVFQDYALFPHLTVRQNVGFGLQGRDRAARDARVSELLALVGLTGFDARYPHELSGGQQQRVALARALAPEPALLLLDEPFSNLDAVLKGQMRSEVAGIIRQSGATALFVVHDAEDALSLADRIAILREGALQQVGTPDAVYARPANLYVARFFGAINVLPARPVDGGLDSPLGFVPAPSADAADMAISVRPEHLELARNGRGTPGVVRRSAFHGGYRTLVVRLEAGGATHDVTLYAPAEDAPEIGATVRVRAPADHIRVLRD